MDDCAQGASNKARIKNIEGEISEIKLAIEGIRETLLGRPTWIVTFLLAFMSSLIVGLIMVLLRK